MKSRKFIILTTLLGGYISSIPALHAQEWKLLSREEIEAKVRPALLPQGQSLIHFDTCRLSVGTLNEEDSPRTVSFHFRNIGTDSITFTRITTTCGCTQAEFNRKPIAPGEEGNIQLTFHPKNRPGTVDAEAMIYTTLSDRSPIARLSLCGYVSAGDEWSHLPQSMGYLRLIRKQVIFSQPGKTASERIVCANSGHQPIRLKALLLPACLQFRTEPAVLAPGQEGDLIITLDTEKLPMTPNTEKHFSILIDGVSGKPSERMIKVIIKN